MYKNVVGTAYKLELNKAGLRGSVNGALLTKLD